MGLTTANEWPDTPIEGMTRRSSNPKIVQIMNITATSVTLSVHHDSWIRHQIRQLVLHLDAPVETAELLQVALIGLSHVTARFEGRSARSRQEQDADFVALAKQRIRDDLADEIRQMTHLSLPQRRHWMLVKLAREHVRLRLRRGGQDRVPSVEEVSLLTGLSVAEVETLQRLANLGPWEADQGAKQLIELRMLRVADGTQLAQAREDTHIVLAHLAPLLVRCPLERLRLVQQHFGVSCIVAGRPVLPPQPAGRSGWLDWVMTRWKPRGRLDRRPGARPPLSGLREDLWPRRMTQFLQPHAH